MLRYVDKLTRLLLCLYERITCLPMFFFKKIWTCPAYSGRFFFSTSLHCSLLTYMHISINMNSLKVTRLPFIQCWRCSFSGFRVRCMGHFFQVWLIIGAQNCYVCVKIPWHLMVLLPCVQVKRKKAKHAGMFDIAKTANRPMIHIGGWGMLSQHLYILQHWLWK